MGLAMSTDAETIAKAAKQAFEASQLISAEERVRALHEIRKELEASKDAILEANKLDVDVSILLYFRSFCTLRLTFDCHFLVLSPSHTHPLYILHASPPNPW